MKGVLLTTSSRVPDNRPGRPTLGNAARPSIDSRTWTTVFTVALALSCRMYDSTESRSRTADFVSRIFKSRLPGLFHLVEVYALASIRLLDTIQDGLNVPLLNREVFFDGLGCQV